MVIDLDSGSVMVTAFAGVFEVVQTTSGSHRVFFFCLNCYGEAQFLAEENTVN